MSEKWNELLALLSGHYIRVIQRNLSIQNHPFAFNISYVDLVGFTKQELELEKNKCLKKSHQKCLPHTCVTAQLKLVEEIKNIFQVYLSVLDGKIIPFTTYDKKEYNNPMFLALKGLQYSDSYAKELVTRTPPIDFLVLNDLTMFCLVQRLPNNRCNLMWAVTSSNLSSEEISALKLKHKAVILSHVSQGTSVDLLETNT